MGRLLGLGSICFGEDQIEPFARDFRALLAEHGVPPETELKWSPDSKNDWFRKHAKQGELTGIRRELLHRAAAHGALEHAAVWDTDAAPTFRGDPPEGWVLTFLFERISIALQNAGRRG